MKDQQIFKRKIHIIKYQHHLTRLLAPLTTSRVSTSLKNLTSIHTLTTTIIMIQILITLNILTLLTILILLPITENQSSIKIQKSDQKEIISTTSNSHYYY